MLLNLRDARIGQKKKPASSKTRTVLDACFQLPAWVVYSLTLQMEATVSPKHRLTYMELHGATS
jgi:hypothetical protein